MKHRIEKFWHKIFSRTEVSGDYFEILQKMVKCVLGLCHSNADVERSFSAKKKKKENVNKAENVLR